MSPVESSSLAIEAFKKMAADPYKRDLLARDTTCIGGLVMVLSNPDDKVVQTALETLLLLSEGTENIPHLSKFIGMQEQLNMLLKRPDTESTFYKMAQELKDIYDRHATDDSLKEGTDNVNSTPVRSANTHRKKRNFFMGGYQGKAKTLILQIHGLKDKHDMDIIRNTVIRIKGVISITFNFPQKRCVIRVKSEMKVETLVHAVAMSGMHSAQQVVRDDEGKEMLLSFGAGQEDNDDDDDKENDDLPQYLPDEESPIKLEHKPMTRNGGPDQQGDSWLFKAASFLSNSFYW